MSRRSCLRTILTTVLLALLISGCGSGDKPSPHADVLSDAQLLPRPTSDDASVGDAAFINILSSTTRTEFPDSLTFTVEAESAGTITDIELRYRIQQFTSATITTTIKPDFTPARHVKAGWTWDTRKASLPPGARIDYRWVLTNSAGEQLTTDQDTLTFEDTRHEWQELTADNIELRWYRGDEGFGQDLLEAAVSALDRLEHDTGAQPKSVVRLYIYGSTGEFQSAMIFPDVWTGGMAFPDFGIVAIGVSTANLEWGKRTVAHELSHVVIGQMVFGPLANMPTWLDEGLAMYVEGDLDSELQDALDEAVSSDSLISIRSLSGAFPADYEGAALAYAESYSMVRLLVEDYGSEKMLALLEVFKQGSSYDKALKAVYEFDVDGFEDRWHESLGL